MVEINNQRKAFLDMLAWSEELITDVRKPEITGLWRHCRRRAIYWLLRSPSQTCHAKPKTQINRAPDATTASSRWWDAASSSLKDFSPKVRTLWHCSRLRSVALYLIDRGDIRQAIGRCSNYLGFTAGRWLWSVRAWADGLIAKFKEAGGTVRDWCMSRSPHYLRSGYLHHRLTVTWAVNHYRDNAVPTKPSATKRMPENWSWRTRQLLTCRCVSVMLLRSMQNTQS